MIPHQLTLRNFLSYGDTLQTIVFQNHSLICLSGRNGHGKSALLDAITWALWGQARKISGVSKPDEGLLRIGSTKMLVSLEFSFNGNIFRVRREFMKTHGKPYSSLDLEVYDEGVQSFSSLTDKTIRATQAKIDSFLSLDYETFINSAFLRQGQSNEFSKKSARERKQILTSILGLSRYEKLQKKALEYVKNYNDKKVGLEILQKRDYEELEREKGIVQEYENYKRKKDMVLSELKDLENSISDYEKQARIVEHNQVHLKNAVDQNGTLKKDERMLCSRFMSEVKQWKTLRVQLEGTIDSQKREEKRVKLLHEEKVWRARLQDHMEVREKLLKVQNQFQEIKGRQERARERHRMELLLSVERETMQLQQLGAEGKAFYEALQTKKNEKVEYDCEYEKTIHDLKEHDAFEQRLKSLCEQFEKRRSYYQIFLDRHHMLDRRLKDLAYKMRLIADKEKPMCPTCETVLSQSRTEYLGAKLYQEKRIYGHQQERVVHVIERLKDLLRHQQKEVEKVKKKKELYVQGALKIETLSTMKQACNKEIERLTSDYEKNQKEAQKQENSVKHVQKKLDALRACKLDDSPELQALQARERSYQKLLHESPYDKKKHDALISELQALEESYLQKEEHDRLVLVLHDIRTSITRLNKEIKHKRMTRTEQEEKIRHLQEVVAQGMRVCEKKDVLQKKHKELSSEKDGVVHRLGRLEHEIFKLKERKKEVELRKKHIEEVATMLHDYQDLSGAFGKDGIQALLIEQAIPEIEQEANKLLSKLTNNGSHILIESLRDLKKGGMRETLDIKISDTLGVRPYEMYSGGEAFRIDFALRIAISKLLARRSGTSLETLIIDEGFGSQDEEGLQRLMDVLYKIQHDFAMIIVVSHLPFFKENFPTHIVVEKNESGSLCRVEERG